MKDDEEVKATSAADSEEDAKALEEFERRPSTLPEIAIEMRNFATEELANSVGEAVHCWLHIAGKLLDLKSLIQVIVAYNYNEALAGIDQGAPVSKPLTATDDGIGVGVAMTPRVLRDGEPKSIMVLNANYLSVFAPNDHPDINVARKEMAYTLVHECGHVHDLGVQAASMPGVILQTALSYRDKFLFYIASGCWEEYIACRLSAFAGTESTLRQFEETFCNSVERAKGRADAAIRQYRMHRDLARVVQEVVEEYKKTLVYASYMLGHIDGLGLSLDVNAPKAMSALGRQPPFRPFVTKLHDELRAMHETYGGWKGLEVFEPLKRLSEELLKLGGIYIQDRPDGAGRVDIPFRAETIPTPEEQAAFLMGESTTGCSGVHS